ncbi:MAG: rhodanese-like domain-containing protein [Nitrospiraceae bacterium]
MPAPNTISIEKLVRLIGTPKCPTLIDVRPEAAFDADPHLIPSSRDRTFEKLGVSTEVDGSQPAVVICQEGTSLSQGVGAWLREMGVPAEVLESRSTS